MLDFGFYNMDCMEGMKDYPDNYFDLAIVDPPYGSGLTSEGGCRGWFEKYHQDTSENAGGVRTSLITTDSGRGSTATRVHKQGKNSRRPDGTWSYPSWWNVGEEIPKKIITWDVAPDSSYFKELFRVSRNQIIWGGNYFELPPTRCFLIWRKLTISESFSMAMCEYAWTSFNDNAKIFEYAPQGRPGDNRFHPTQKPVALYEWILNRYAKEGDTILDTHVGSASSLIACRNTNHKYVGFEIDKDYYRLAKERLEKESAQMNIYDFI